MKTLKVLKHDPTRLKALKLLIQGLTLQEISKHLGVEYETARNMVLEYATSTEWQLIRIKKMENKIQHIRKINNKLIDEAEMTPSWKHYNEMKAEVIALRKRIADMEAASLSEIKIAAHECERSSLMAQTPAILKMAEDHAEIMKGALK